MNRFEAKTAFITGGTSGIGLATAIRLRKEGANVVVCGLDQQKGENVSAEHGIDFIACDVRDEDNVKVTVESSVSRYGSLDIVVNAAGVSTRGEFDVTTYGVEDYDRTMDTNMKGTFLVTKHTIPHLIKSKGTLLNIGSRLALKPIQDDAFIYASSKAAVAMFTKAMALNYRKDEVRINCLCPGPVDTPLLRALYDSEDDFKADGAHGFHGRIATPEEEANVAAFLLSDEASYVHGAIWTADGGASI